MKKEKLFLIDGNSYCYRAFYAIKELRNSKGLPTNAIYGFLLMLRKLIDAESPDYFAVAFDLKGKTFRHEKYSDYKIQRKPMPEDLVVQIPLIKDLVAAYNVPIFEKEGFEADDVLATIASNASSKGLDVFIVTGDKDALQLVTDNVKVYNAAKEGLIYDRKKVKERYQGLGPDKVIEIMALSGDQTDNIPGVKGIGEKTAIELIKEFGTVENIYKNIDKIKSDSRRDILKNGENSAYMSKELATVDKSVPIDIDIEKMKITEFDNKKLLELFKEFEFKVFAKEMASNDSELRSKACYATIKEKKDFERFLKTLEKQKEFVLDFETTSANPLEAEPLGLSFCWKEGEAYYLVFDCQGQGPTLPTGRQAARQARDKGQGLDLDYVFKKLKPIMENEKIRKVGQNIKYEMLVFSNYGIKLKGVSFDTMVASYLLNPSKFNHNLDDMAFEYLDHKMISMEDLVGTGKKKIAIEDVPVEKISEYSCEDSDATFRLKKILEKKLFEKGLESLFRKIELPLVDVLFDMERVGVKIDTGFLNKMSKELEKDLDSIVTKIYKLAGEEFNINSPKQLSEILFVKMGLPVIKKTKTGASTDVGVLERLSLNHELPAEILKYRELSKLKSTYVDALPDMVNKKTGRLHTSFNQTVTATGRLSSSNPNLQNVPIRTEQGRKIRKAFTGEKNNYIFSADYSQIELRILAHLSDDEELIKAFEEERDVHTHTASLIFDVKETEIDKEMRANAKTVNFGIVYGISAFGLARGLGIDPGSAQEFIDNYFERYPRVKIYMEDKIEEARSTGYVTTLFNRRRYIPEINTGGVKEQQQASRVAINTPIQGSAADLIKIAMINIQRSMKAHNLCSVMTMQVHDELVFEVTEKEKDIMEELIRTEMENAVKMNVPIRVTIKKGKNWLESEEC